MNNEISFKDIIENRSVLSPNNYIKINIDANDSKELQNFILKIDKGNEVGSINYVDKSNYKFIRTSAFNENKFSLVEDERSILSIAPSSFVNYNLKKNDILICKDSNVGEVVRLNKNYENFMFSSGINRLEIKEFPEYIFGIMKHHKFKEQLVSMIPKGATLMHAKDLYKKCIIPFPKNKEVLNYVESMVRIIEQKEIELTNKINLIDSIIYKEIKEGQKRHQFDYAYPTINELMKINRLDTGNYTKEFCNIDYLLKNYVNGVFYLDKKNVKGGNTPIKRVISSTDNYKFRWITPSYINSDGTLDLSYSINCNNNNINENCALVINRTSKGGVGEYVGIASYYNYNKFGVAQHNQGIYKIFNIDDKKLILITCLLNSKMYRTYCANLSMGSKMKELKLNNVLSIPFPNFKQSTIDKIVSLYYNSPKKKSQLNQLFEEENDKWNINAGVLDLFESIQASKATLNKIIDNIYDGKIIDLNYCVF